MDVHERNDWGKGEIIVDYMHASHSSPLHGCHMWQDGFVECEWDNDIEKNQQTN